MYVKAYLDLSAKSRVLWLLFSVCAPGSLAGGFLVAVAGCALFVVLLFLFGSLETSAGMVLSFVSRFHVHNGLRSN